MKVHVHNPSTQEAEAILGYVVRTHFQPPPPPQSIKTDIKPYVQLQSLIKMLNISLLFPFFIFFPFRV